MKTRIISTILVFLVLTIKAQEKTITGIVKDSTGVLPGVIVLIKGTTIATETDFDGKYSIKANLGDKLQFKYLGYKTEERTVSVNSVINIILNEDASILEEIVVVGYGSTTSKALTGSVSGVVVKSSTIRIRGYGSVSGKVEKKPQSGQLTAGEINDLKKWKQWNRIYKKDSDFLRIKEKWELDLNKRIDVSITNEEKKPLVNAIVYLVDKEGNCISKMKSDVFGKVTFFDNSGNANLIQVKYQDEIMGQIIKKNKTNHFNLNSEHKNEDLDIMFTIDATGSMSDELNYLTSEVENIITRIDTTKDNTRVALTFYRDEGDKYVVKDYDFNSNIKQVKEALVTHEARGGGDYEEAVEKALKASLSKSWNEKAKARLMFLLLDAPPHFNEENVKIIKKQINLAKEKGIKIIPIVSSGADKTVEFLMRYFSISTNGTYVFLTDDSGIGNPHLKPTKSKYEVEKLNDLIVRLIKKYANV